MKSCNKNFEPGAKIFSKKSSLWNRLEIKNALDPYPWVYDFFAYNAYGACYFRQMKSYRKNHKIVKILWKILRHFRLSHFLAFTYDYLSENEKTAFSGFGDGLWKKQSFWKYGKEGSAKKFHKIVFVDLKILRQNCFMKFSGDSNDFLEKTHLKETASIYAGTLPNRRPPK